MNIDLDDRAWFDAIPVGGIGVHVVEGVYGGLRANAIQEPFNVPPPEWVALSEQKCETCEGAGWDWAYAIDDDAPANRFECPACRGSGRPLVQVTVPCDWCYGSGIWDMNHTGSAVTFCRSCARGRVSIGSVTVEAVEACDNGRDFGVIVRRVS